MQTVGLCSFSIHISLNASILTPHLRDRSLITGKEGGGDYKTVGMGGGGEGGGETSEILPLHKKRGGGANSFSHAQGEGTHTLLG